MPFKEKQVVWIEFQNHADPQAKVHPAGRKPPLSIFKPLVLLQFDTAFSRGEVGIPMNGLVWMGSHDEMLRRMEEKLAQGFRCIKIKIGAIGFDEELDLIRAELAKEGFVPHAEDINL